LTDAGERIELPDAWQVENESRDNAIITEPRARARLVKERLLLSVCARVGCSPSRKPRLMWPLQIPRDEPRPNADEDVDGRLRR